MRHPLLPTLLCLVLLGACVKTPDGGRERRIEPDFDKQTIIDEAKVVTDEPQLYIRPQGRPNATGPALVLPMEVRQPVDNPGELGRELGRLLALTWSQEAIFPEVIYAADLQWADRSRAMDLATARNASFVVRPVLNHLLLSGSSGATSLSLSVEIYSSASGDTLWSMAQAGRMDRPPDRDYIVFRRTVRMPAAPEYVVLTVLARDMGKPVRRWLQSAAPAHEPAGEPPSAPSSGDAPNGRSDSEP